MPEFHSLKAGGRCMKKRRKNCGQIPIWQPAIMNAAILLITGIAISLGIQKGVLHWEAAARLMKAAVALSTGITTLHYCKTAPNNKLSSAGSVFMGGITLLLISESMHEGLANWNPAAGLIICIFGCLLGLAWSTWKRPKRGR